MKKLYIILLSALVLVSCQYKQYADADYPENTIYQPMAEYGVWYINSACVEDAGLPTAGAPLTHYLDKETNEFVINMGVVQSGVKLKSFPVSVMLDNSTVASMIISGQFDSKTVPFPDGFFTIPETIQMSADRASTPFEIRLQAALFFTPQYVGKKFAIAVEIASDHVKVNEDLAKVIICLDPAYLVYGN